MGSFFMEGIRHLQNTTYTLTANTGAECALNIYGLNWKPFSATSAINKTLIKSVFRICESLAGS